MCPLSPYSPHCVTHSFLPRTSLSSFHAPHPPTSLFSLLSSRNFTPLAAVSSLFLMKQLIRRLSRVSDSSQSQYCLLRSESQEAAAAARRPGRAQSFRAAAASKFRRCRQAGSVPVPQGHVPVFVGDEMERFVVSAELLNHPVFIMLLNKSAQEYGYEQKGVLRIPCHVLVFERVLEALRTGDEESRDLQDLLTSLSDDFL